MLTYAVIVTQGYCYKLRFAYAHFPINVSVVKDKLVEVRNFLGEKRVRRVAMLGDTTVMRSAEVKDQLEIYGNDIELVSRSGAWRCLQCALAPGPHCAPHCSRHGAPVVLGAQQGYP